MVAALATGKAEAEVTGEERRRAKPINFGKPGAMGDATLKGYARASYGVDLSDTEIEALSEAWLGLFPEMHEFLLGGSDAGHDAARSFGLTPRSFSRAHGQPQVPRPPRGRPGDSPEPDPRLDVPEGAGGRGARDRRRAAVRRRRARLFLGPPRASSGRPARRPPRRRRWRAGPRRPCAAASWACSAGRRCSRPRAGSGRPPRSPPGTTTCSRAWPPTAPSSPCGSSGGRVPDRQLRPRRAGRRAARGPRRPGRDAARGRADGRGDAHGRARRPRRRGVRPGDVLGRGGPPGRRRRGLVRRPRPRRGRGGGDAGPRGRRATSGAPRPVRRAR